MPINWNSITAKAYCTLIELGVDEFPVSPTKIKCKGITITSYQKYARRTGKSIEEITCGHELDDAFYLPNLKPDFKIILYNKEKMDSRLKHSLWHEVGHAKLGHTEHGDQEEIEAHFFAAQANAPNVLIREIHRRGYIVDKKSLIDKFGLSEESASKKMDYLRRHAFDHTNEYDDVILQQFSAFLNLKYSPKVSSYYDDDYEEMERARTSWY